VRFLLLLSLSFLFLLGAAGGQTAGGETAEELERRRAFLRAREQMRTIPAATPPAAAATPRPRPKPVPQPATPAPPPPPPETTPPPTLPPPPAVTPPPPATPRAARVTPRPAVTPPPIPRARPTPLLVITPKPVPTQMPRRTDREPAVAVTVKKTGFEDAEIVPAEQERRGWFGSGGPRYKYLTNSIRQEIDRAPVRRNRWRYIVVHNSATRQGSAKAFHNYHLRVRKMPNGLAYHFVIGNGTSTRDGEIEIGSRWTRQINGGHVHSDYLNNISLGICFVGDFDRDLPTQRQLEALDELIRYLRKRVGRVDGRVSVVKAHREINPPRWPTSCPGKRFPYRWMHSKFN
jgi:outer membrane biosynthesis protein TonB